MTKQDYTAVTLAELSRILGKAHQMLYRWFDKDCPFTEEDGRKTYNVKDVFDWRISYERKLCEDVSDARENRSEDRLYEQKIRKAKADADKVERQNMVSDGVLLMREDVERTLRAAAAMFKAVATAEKKTRSEEDYQTGADIDRLIDTFIERVHSDRDSEAVGDCGCVPGGDTSGLAEDGDRGTGDSGEAAADSSDSER